MQSRGSSRTRPIDDVQETGWGVPDHLWVVRSIQVDVVSPLLRDREIELATWCSGVAAIAAGQALERLGDAGGSVEIDSVWIHLDRDQRPARIGNFGPYECRRRGSRRLDEAPPADAAGGHASRPLAAADDRHRCPRPRQQRRALAGGGGLARPRGGRSGATLPRVSRLSRIDRAVGGGRSSPRLPTSRGGGASPSPSRIASRPSRRWSCSLAPDQRIAAGVRLRVA